MVAERTIEDKQRTIPVSRSSFALTDRNAFDAAVQLAVSWVARTAATSLPDAAITGHGFTLEEEGAKASASALRIDDSQGRVWAAKVNYHADRISHRRWITDLFVEQRAGSFVRFGAQLACRCSGDDPGFDHSRPRVVHDVLANLAGDADGEALTNHVQQAKPDDVDHLVSLLYSHNRRLPVVVVSIDDKGGAQLDLEVLAKRLSGTAHLRCAPSDTSEELTRTIGKRMSVFNGAVRIYMPGLDQENQDPFKHPLWLAPRSGWNPGLVHQIASRILPLGFQDSDGDARFWRLGLLRQATSRALANSANGSNEERLRAEVDALRAETEASREAAQSAESLMYEESSKLNEIRAENARLEDQAYSLRERIRSLSTPNKFTSISISPNDIYSLFDQNPDLETSLRIIGSAFSDRVIVLDSAYESARDSYSFLHRKKAFDLLWSLCTTYWIALCEGESDATARQCFGASYAAKEADTLSKAGRRRRTFAFEGGDIEMERHLKIGVADNRAETLRVHFEWLGEKQRIVIGHCGGHLDF